MRSFIIAALVSAAFAQTTAVKTTTTTTAVAPATTTTTVAPATTTTTVAPAAAPAPACTGLNCVNPSAASNSGVYPTTSVNQWSSFAAGLPGNTTGWAMSGNFNVNTQSQGAVSVFQVTLQVWPPTGTTFVTGSVMQSWISFAGWDTSVSTVTTSSNNAVVSNALTVSTANAVTMVATLANSCGTGALSQQTKYASVVGINAKCTNPWSTATSNYAVDPSGATTNWQVSSTFSRPYTFAAANTLAMGQTIGWTTGFYLWSNATATATATASGYGSPVTWILTDSSSALAVSAAAVALLALSF